MAAEALGGRSSKVVLEHGDVDAVLDRLTNCIRRLMIRRGPTLFRLRAHITIIVLPAMHMRLKPSYTFQAKGLPVMRS